MHKITSTQPENVKQRIYGGDKLKPTIKVRLKGTKKVVVINEADFDSEKHVSVK